MGFKLRPGTSVFGNVTFTPGTNENYVAPPTHGSVNVALTATSTASTHIGDRPPSLAHDGIIGISDTDGSTISNLNAWVTTGERVGAWMQLDWSTPQTVNKIKLYDRPNVTHDHIKGGTLTFSDGSSVTVGELPDGVVNGAPDPLEVTFDVKTITWVRFTVDAFTGHNAGLTEFEVWSVLVAPEPAPAPSIVTEGLTFHVDAGNISSYSGSGDWIDLTGNGGDATLTNGMSFDAANGGSFVIDGADDFAQFPSTALVSGNGAFTNEFWFKWSGASGPQVIFGYGNDTGPNAVNVSTVTNNKFRFEFGSGAGIADSTTTINTGTWYHAAVAYDQSSVKIYINGVLEATTPHSSANVPLFGYGGENGSIGALFSTWGNVSANGTRRYGTFGGNVAVVRQYNRALNGTEIQFNYDASKDRY